MSVCKLWEKNRGAVKSSSPLCLSSYRLIRTDNGKTSSDSQHTSKTPLFLTTNHKDGCFSPTFNPLLVSLFPYLQPSLPTILPESLIRSLLSKQTHLLYFWLLCALVTTGLCNMCNFFRQKLLLICEKKMQILHICPSH